MSLKSQRIAALSRDPRFLFRTVILILLAGAAVAFGVSLLRGEKEAPEVIGEALLFRRQTQKIASRGECVRLLEQVRQARAEMQEVLRGELPSPATAAVREDFSDLGKASAFLREEEVKLFGEYAAKMIFPGTVTEEDIAPFAAAEPASGLIGAMHGDLLRIAGKYEEALAAYERGAIDMETGADARRRALDLCRRREWKTQLSRLYRMPGWREAVIDHRRELDPDSWEVVVAAGDWPGVLRMVWDGVLERLKSPLWVTLAGLCGLLWFLMLHAGAGIPRNMWGWSLAAFGLGLLSIPLTHIIDTAQTVWFGAQPEGTELTDIMYCVSGIGLREEVAKLICFLPMLFLLRSASPARVLAVAACVGLGFATLENVGYFARQHGSSVWGRFLMANFTHSALTGLTGLALWQAVRNSKWLSHFAWVFIGAVVFHGLWDWSPQDDRIAADYRWMMFAGLVGLSYYFFGELLRYSQPRPGVPSGTFVFLAGGAVLLSVLMSVLSWRLGFREGFAQSMEPVLQYFFVGAVMYFQLRKA